MVGRRYPELDGIRGVAILAVLVFHARTVAEPFGTSASLYRAAAEAGWVGVDLFFVLSGFLITGILLDTCERQRYFRNFYMRRVLRIFPLYYAALVVLAVAARLTQFAPAQGTSPAAEASFWLYLQNWLAFFKLEPTPILGHFWSLAVEEQFYLLWPALVFVAVRRRFEGALCVAAVVVAVVVRIALVKAGERAAYDFTFARLDALALGAGVAVLYRRLGSLDRLRTSALVTAAVCVAAVAFVAWKREGFYGRDRVVLSYGLLPLATLFAASLVIAMTGDADGPLRRALRSRWLGFVGAISYGMYVFHWPVITVLKTTWTDRSDAVGNHLAFLAVVAAATTLVAWLSFRFFESPILRMKERFSSRPETSG
jgi:peptidoglycan/LPS O-acetylase OafA/YrhL